MVSKMVPTTLYEIREYLTADGASPFAMWRRTVDAQARARVDRVLERFGDGNFGDHKGVGDGVLETRLNAGPGYRIYYARDGATMINLLAGGIKASQNRDIVNAKDRWKDYKERKRSGG